jgi:hypothetical protein
MTLLMIWPNSGMAFSIYINNDFNGGNGEKLLVKGILLEHTLWKRFMNALTLTPTIWVI